MTAYYNEIDPRAAQWIRNLIAAGHIAPGEVDERSIEDVRPSDLDGFVQCHFFAGIAVWSHALRKAGWPDSRPVWTGSCPCQPFSAAGKGGGFTDERHLWPAFNHLISQCKPDIVFGEQVASKDGLNWVDLVHTDLDAQGYAFGAVDTCAAGFGSPQIRQRLYWVAHPKRNDSGRKAESANHRQSQADRSADWAGGYSGAFGWVADTESDGHEWAWKQRQQAGRDGSAHDNPISGMDNTISNRRGTRRNGDNAEHVGQQLDANGSNDRPGPTNGFWRDADWLGCRDGKWRPVRPGSFPLAYGAPARVGRLRAYGNGLCAIQAQGFIESVMDYMGPSV